MTDAIRQSVGDDAFLAGGGEVGALLRSHDWSASPLGAPHAWPQSFRSVVGLLLASKFPMFVAWGPDLGFLYNDAYAEILGAKHPAALGARFHDIWSEIWTDISPLIDTALAGRSTFREDLPLVINRQGSDEQAWFTFSYSPVRDESGRVSGMFCTVAETTVQVLSKSALAAERDRSQGVLDGMAEGFALLDRAFHILDLNAEAMRLETRPRKAIVGRTHWEVYPGSEESELGLLYKRAMAERMPVSLEHLYRWEDGREVWLEMRAYPVEQGLAVFYRDISERKNAEAALRASTARAEALAAEQAAILGQLAEGVIVTDPVGRITFVNEAAARIHGVARLDVEPDAYSETYHLLTVEGELYPPHDLPLARAVREGETVVEARWRIRRPNGTEVLAVGSAQPVLDAEGNRIGAALTLRDDTEREAAERRLRELNETLEQRVADRSAELDRVWRLSQDLLVVAETDGVLRSVNAAWTVLLGWKEAELVGRTFMELAHPDDLEPTLAAFAGILVAPLVVPHEYRLCHKDGTYRWFAWTAAFENGAVYATGRDVTDQKEQAEALAQAQDALRQSQKMEAVGQLTGGLAHDFNNLLAGISGSLDLMASRIAQGRLADVDRYLVAAQGASKRAAALTHRLLAFSRRQTLAPKITNVNGLVIGMEDLIRRTVGPQIAVENALDGGLWSVLVDAPQLENALLNLAINARDAMPEGGKLTIETGNRWLDERAARMRDLPPGQYVSLCVSDNGTGMTADVIAKAFDPFYTTKPIGLGTGLGLSMVYGFVRQSGGQARIYSEVGQGTMVCLYLPRHVDEAEGPEVDGGDAPATPHVPAVMASETVLVIDDEPVVRMLIVDVLEELGYAALQAGDGPAGLKVLQSGARVDLLVTDVGLPGGLNGRQVADAARSLRPDLKVLFITGYAENAVLNHGHLEHGMQVVTKPFAVEDLVRKIRDILSGE